MEGNMKKGRDYRNLYVILLGLLSIGAITDQSDDNYQEQSGEYLVDWFLWKTSVDETEVEESFPGHDDAVFLIINVGYDGSIPQEDNHLAYSYYIIADHHIGGLEGEEWEDYNKQGYEEPLDMSPYPSNDSNKPPFGMPDVYGSNPGKDLGRAINLANAHYLANYGQGVENGEAVFLIDLGDIAARAELSEFQHARFKAYPERPQTRLPRLDSLLMPWIPVIGNHDTWATAGGVNDNEDRYFEQVFGSHLDSMVNVFPNWVRMDQTRIEVNDIIYGSGWATPEAWRFYMGPNLHFGLDFVGRTYGGDKAPSLTAHMYPGTWDWFYNDRNSHPYIHERILFAAHNPLNFPKSLGYQFENDDAKTIVKDVNDFENEKAYWFSGHLKKDTRRCWGTGLL